MREKIIEAIIFSIVIPTFFGVIGAISDARDVIMVSIAVGIYSAAIYTVNLIREFYWKEVKINVSPFKIDFLF